MVYEVSQNFANNITMMHSTILRFIATALHHRVSVIYILGCETVEDFMNERSSQHRVS